MIIANKFIKEKLNKILEDGFPPSNESDAVKKSFKRHRKKKTALGGRPTPIHKIPTSAQ